VKLSRRAFVVGAASATTCAGLGAWRGCWYPGAGAFAGLRVLSPRQGVIMAAVADAVLPDEAARDAETVRGHVAAIDEFLVGLPAGNLDDLDRLCVVLEHATLPFGGHLRRFSSLSRAARREVLADWRAAGRADRRLGFRSLKAIVFLAWYRTPEAWAGAGYEGPILPAGGAAAPYDALRAPAGARPGWP
jgi:hypothetical protein